MTMRIGDRFEDHDWSHGVRVDPPHGLLEPGGHHDHALERHPRIGIDYPAVDRLANVNR